MASSKSSKKAPKKAEPAKDSAPTKAKGKTKAASNPGVWVLVIAGGGFALMSLREYGRTPRGASTLYRGLLSVPGVGPLVHSACMARYTCGLGTMLSGGAELLVDLGRGLACAEPAIRE